jgi:hypothetical protein
MKKYLLIILIAQSLCLVAQNIVIDRPLAGNGFVTSSEGGQSIDLYVADDFVLTETTTLGEIDLWGKTNFDAINTLESFNIIIYEDTNGLPSNNPTQLGTGIIELRNIPLSIIDIEIVNSTIMNFLNIPLTQANNDNQITLNAGTYWFCAYATFTSTTLNSYWSAGLAQVPDEGSNSRRYSTFTGAWAPITSLGPDSFTTIAITLRDETLLHINDIDNHHKVDVFPNPASTAFTIRLPNNIDHKGELNMRSTDGRLVYSIELNKNYPNGLLINTSEFSKGLYIINLKLNNTLITKKILIN